MRPDFARGLISALAFLTRLAPGQPLSEDSLSKAVPWFAPAGVVLGLACALPPLCVPFFAHNALPFHPWLMGLLWITLEIWFSHGMHWDGLADLGDALGSGATGEKFWQILHDSRLGSFGALTLLAVFSAQWLLAAWHFSLALPEPDNWNFPALFPLLLAPAWGRLTPAWLSFCPASSKSVLGTAVYASFKKTGRIHAFILGFSCLLASVILGMNVWMAILMAVMQLLLILWLSRAAHNHGGMSGDFFGAGIVLSQTLFLFFTI